MKGDFHVRFRENLRVKLPWVTRLVRRPSGQKSDVKFTKFGFVK